MGLLVTAPLPQRLKRSPLGFQFVISSLGLSRRRRSGDQGELEGEGTFQQVSAVFSVGYLKQGPGGAWRLVPNIASSHQVTTWLVPQLLLCREP